MEHSSSWEANNHSASQEILRLLWNPKVHYRVHKSPPLVPILNQMDLVHNFPNYFLRSRLIFYAHLRLRLPSGLFPSGFSDQNFVYISHLSHACYTAALLTLFYLIAPTIFGEECKLWNSSLFRDRASFPNKLVFTLNCEPPPKHQVWWPPLIGCPRLLIQYNSHYLGS
jgi:hypothetical protein